MYHTKTSAAKALYFSLELIKVVAAQVRLLALMNSKWTHDAKNVEGNLSFLILAVLNFLDRYTNKEHRADKCLGVSLVGAYRITEP